MDAMDPIVDTLARTMGVAWASGINLYAAILVLGLLGTTGDLMLPDQLAILTNPLVLVAAGAMFMVEFVIDKIPGVDTGWDALHTFIRIPAGALLAAGAVGDVTPALSVAAGIMGGGLAAASHGAKAGSRVVINASPEPFTNWAASVGEDLAVIGGLWVALNHPLVFLLLLALFILLLIWLLPKVWRGIKRMLAAIRRWFGGAEPPAPAAGSRIE